MAPATRNDDYTAQLAEHLDHLARAGIDATSLLHTTTEAPLPDDHAASALWWRIQHHLPDRGNPTGSLSAPWPMPGQPTSPGGEIQADIDDARTLRRRMPAAN